MDSSVKIKMLNDFQIITDVAMNGSGDDLKQAQKILEELCNNEDVNNDDLLHIIKVSNHKNSIYFATQVLTYRIIQNPSRYAQHEKIWPLFLQFAASEVPLRDAFVRAQFIKSASKLIVSTFFADVVNGRDTGAQKGPLFTVLEELLQCQQDSCKVKNLCTIGSLTVIELMDELLYQIVEDWRLNASLPYDHILLIRKCLTNDNALCFFVQLGIQLGQKIIIHPNDFDEKRKHIHHLCEFFERVVKFSVNHKKLNSFFDDNHYYPPQKLNIQEFADFAFELKKFVPEDDELSLQCYTILTRLCYASGPVFANDTIVSRYRGNYRRNLTILLNSISITHENLDSILSLLCNFTCILYAEQSFDRTITEFSQCVATVLHKMVPFIYEKLFEVEDHQTRKILRNFGSPMKFLALCLQDDEEVFKLFSPIIYQLLDKMVHRTNALSQDKESLYNYKVIIQSLTNAALYFFEDFYRKVCSIFPVQTCDFTNIQHLNAMSWYCYIVAELMKRSCAEDSILFFTLEKSFYQHKIPNDEYMDDESGDKLHAVNHEKCLLEYKEAFMGTFPDLDNIDYISSFMATLLWWLFRIESAMRNKNNNLVIHNSNLLAATFWALQQGMNATSSKMSKKVIGRLNLKDDDFSSELVSKLLNKIFRMIDVYREYPHVVKEAMAVVEAMGSNGFFSFQFGPLLNIFEEAVQYITIIPERRQLFAIGAKAACSSYSKGDVIKFLEVASKSCEISKYESGSNPDAMIIVIEIFTGIADASVAYRYESVVYPYGMEIAKFFKSLYSIYTKYRHCPKVVLKILEFVIAAVPCLMSYGYYSNDSNIFEIISQFIQWYCKNEAQRWNEIDEKKDSANDVYDDLIILMNIVHDALGQITLLLGSGDEDDNGYEILEHLGSQFLHIFVPYMTATRLTVPQVLKAFTQMLYSITEYSVMSVVNYVQNVGYPLSLILMQIVQSSQTSELIDQTFSIIDFILQKHEIVYKKQAWRDFFRYAINPIFNIVITSTKDDSLYHNSRSCLFYIIYADQGYSKFYFRQITLKQPTLLTFTIDQAFVKLCNLNGNQTATLCHEQFIKNCQQFRNSILGNLTFNPNDMDMKAIVEKYVAEKE